MLASAVERPEEFPNLLAGTFTDGQSFSTGNTLPLVGRPWGFNHWAPQTNDGKSSWWFRGDQMEFHGLRLTHQPSPWIGDWGWLHILPQMGPRTDDPVMFFEPWGARIKPHVFDATMGPDNLRVQLSPTDHGAVLKVTFPKVEHLERRVCFKMPMTKGRQQTGNVDADAMTMELLVTRGPDPPTNFGMRFRAEVHKGALKQRSLLQGSGGYCFEFDENEEAVTIWMATSLISESQAALNLEREVRGRTFEEIEEESALVWRALLGRLDVLDPGPLTQETFKRLTNFYSGLYRALCFPRRLDEVDAEGRRVHWSPYDPNGGVHEGVVVTDNGFWDTFRTVYTLLALVYPEEAGVLVQGWLNAYKHGGWLPEWSSPGYRDSMVGSYADVVVADAVLKDLPGVDLQLAWEAIRKDSFVQPPAKGKYGKRRYDVYDNQGYVPNNVGGDSASETLDYAFADYSVGLAAAKLGKADDANRLKKRALAAREHMFHRKTGLMLPKNSGGQFRSSQDPRTWGDGFVEGSAWHHSFPPFDLGGLATLHGSKEALARKIYGILLAPGSFNPGSYRQIIHEMKEMRALGMGQYGHNNQPGHHILWLLLALDEGSSACSAQASSPSPTNGSTFCPRLLGENALAAVVDRAYAIDFFSGDEDNGEMGAWYVLQGLGLFEPAPGTDYGYALGSPLFRRTNIYRSAAAMDNVEQPSLSIHNRLAGASRDVPHVSRVLLNGEDVGFPATEQTLGWTLQHERLVGKTPGAVLRFVMAGEDAPDATAGANSSGGKRRPLLGRQRLKQQQQQQQAQGTEEEPKANLPEDLQSVDGELQRHQEDQLRTRISELERQLKERPIPVERSEPYEPINPDPEGVELGVVPFCIILLVNVLAWAVCIRRKGGAPKRKEAD